MTATSQAMAQNRRLNRPRKEEEPESWVLVVVIELTDKERAFDIVQKCRRRHDKDARGYLFKDEPVFASVPVEEYLP